MNNKFLCFFFLAGIAACNTHNADSTAEISAGPLFYDYQLWAEEGSGTATLRLQYKEGGRDGRAVPLPGADQVLLDATPFQLDSTRFLGAYYELTKPLQALQGQHTITIVDASGKAHEETFLFEPFALAEELPEQLRQDSLIVSLTNMPSSPTRIRLVMMDTTLTSSGINEEILVKDGQLNIGQALLSKLASGPVTMEISREEEKTIRGGSQTKGTFLLNYGIRRQFELVE